LPVVLYGCGTYSSHPKERMRTVKLPEKRLLRRIVGFEREREDVTCTGENYTS
jgi:hypothetical protein